jgi:hypothetical protein
MKSVKKHEALTASKTPMLVLWVLTPSSLVALFASNYKTTRHYFPEHRISSAKKRRIKQKSRFPRKTHMRQTHNGDSMSVSTPLQHYLMLSVTFRNRNDTQTNEANLILVHIGQIQSKFYMNLKKSP